MFLIKKSTQSGQQIAKKKIVANGFLPSDVSRNMKTGPTAELAALLAQAGWLRRFARALVRDEDAADLAQDTLTTALRQPSAGRGRAWLATVARNLAVDRFRRDERRDRREAVASDDGQVATPEELIANAQIHRHVAEAVATLPEPFRQTLVLRFYQGLTAAEIARKLGEPEGTIRWRVKEGLQRVRRELDARHHQARAEWVAALSPLLPKSDAPIPRPPLRLFPAAISFVGLVLGLLGIVTCLVVLRARPHTPSPMVEATTEPAYPARAVSPPRLAPASATVPAEEPSGLPPGPGMGDAQALAEELLRAVENQDYDAFVAKGAAAFRAAVTTEGFAQFSAKMRERLSHGRRVTPLGPVRRPEHVDWLFKIEFADDGDDALVTLPMDGWQVAGFLINEPIPMPEEKSP